MKFKDLIARLESGTSNQRACAIALCYGTIDTEDHKMWVIDQMLRLLAGDAYRQLIETHDQEDGYEWDTGIAP